MRVALLMEFKPIKKEPLGDMIHRIHGLFATAGLGEPEIHFSFVDPLVATSASAVDRVLKKHKDLAQFATAAPMFNTAQSIKSLSNLAGSPGAGQVVPLDTLVAIASGGPRSFPFYSVTITFGVAELGSPITPGGPPPGITIADHWWISGRKRSLSAHVIVEAQAKSKQPLQLPPKIVSLLAPLGKPKSTKQLVLSDALAAAGQAAATPSPPVPAQLPPEKAAAVGEVIRRYRDGLAATIEAARMPHDLPPAADAWKAGAAGEPTGPKKPVLLRYFKPLGYDCKGGSGTFTLRRKTAGNLTVDISLDVGTWSRKLIASYRVFGLGFRAPHPLPVARGDGLVPGPGYPIRGDDVWLKLVENLAAVVAQLDRTFVPDIEAAAGPSPEWFSPES